MLPFWRKVYSTLFMLFTTTERITATDPIFKFIPKASLSNLQVQQVSRYDIEMVVGTNVAARTVVSINGPYADGHAGMTGVSMAATSKGSNVASPNISSLIMEESSTANDGLYDVMYMNISSVSRAAATTTTVSYNTLKFEASMKTVDKPGATSTDTLWVWASAEMGDEYIWVSEEATTVTRNAGDRPYLSYTFGKTYNINTFSGLSTKFNGSVFHNNTTSRLNAYNVKLRFYLPPYVEYVADSYSSNEKFSRGEINYDTQQNKNEFTIFFPKIGITDRPRFWFHLKFFANKLHLREGESYQARFDFLMSYCNDSTCAPAGAIEHLKNVYYKTFENAKTKETFLIQHVASGRCFSHTSGTNGERVTLKAACNEHFAYQSNGDIQHVSSSACLYVTSGGLVKISPQYCGRLQHVMHKNGMLRGIFGSGCIAPEQSGVEGDFLKQIASCSNGAKFKFIDAIPGTARLAMGNKVIMFSEHTVLFFCNRQSNPSKPSCFYKNGTYASPLKALPVDMAYVKLWDASKSELYGISFSGEYYVKISLATDPLVAYQIEDDLWTAVSGQSGIKASTPLTESSLKDYPVQHLATGYAVSLHGIHQQDSSTWKLVSRW